MPINPIPPLTKKEKAQEALAKSEGWLYKHAPGIALFLAGFLVGNVLRVL